MTLSELCLTNVFQAFPSKMSHLDTALSHSCTEMNTLCKKGLRTSSFLKSILHRPVIAHIHMRFCFQLLGSLSQTIIHFFCFHIYQIPSIPTLPFTMVYPKHQALPPSPHKTAKTSNTSSYSVNNEMNTTSPSSSSSSSNLSSDYDSYSSSPSQVDSFSIIFEMMKNYNTMIEMQQTSIKNVEEEYAKSSAMFVNKFDVLHNHVKALEERIKEIEGKATTNTKHIAELSSQLPTSDVLESRLRLLTKRVSSVEHVIILNGSRKRMRSSQGEDTVVN